MDLKDFAEQLMVMAKFRNKLVHVYWELDRDIIYEIMQDRLTDFETYLTVISDYLKREKL